MVNDQYFGREQIPVIVAGRTYYGCCEGCKERLSNDAAIREAIDPATGSKVDKAEAIIVARPDGRVYYFASEETLRRFRQLRTSGEADDS